MRGGLRQSPGAEQRASDAAVQPAPPRASDPLVDRLLDERVRDLVGELMSARVLRDQPQAGEVLGDSGQSADGESAVRYQTREVDARLGGRQRLQRRSLRLVEGLDASADA